MIKQTTYPLAQLVSSPDTYAEIYFDFNDEACYPDHDTFKFKPPQLLGEPGGISAEYDYRTIEFDLVIPGDEDDIARQHSLLAKNLMRDNVYFRWQTSANSAPVWFKCVRSSPGETSIADFYLDRAENYGRVAVALIAEPFAVGEELSFTVTIANNPEAGAADGITQMTEDIRGDVPAPAKVVLPPGGSAYFQPFLSILPLDTKNIWLNTVFWTAASATRPNGGVVEADAESAQGTRIRFSFSNSTQEMARRLTWSVAPPFAGRWRLFARCGHWIQLPVDGVADINIKGTGEAATSARGRRSHIQAVNYSPTSPFRASYMVDLGLYTFPKGNLPTSPGYTLSPSEVGMDVGVDMPSGTTFNFWIDYIVAIPIDLPVDAVAPATTMNFQDADRTRGVLYFHIDSENETVVEKFVSGNVGPPGNPEAPAGGALMLTPGALNLLSYLPRRAYNSTYSTTNFQGAYTLLWTERKFRHFVQPRDSLDEVNDIVVSYRPRWLYFSDI